MLSSVQRCVSTVSWIVVDGPCARSPAGVRAGAGGCQRANDYRDGAKSGPPAGGPGLGGGEGPGRDGCGRGGRERGRRILRRSAVRGNLFGERGSGYVSQRICHHEGRGRAGRSGDPDPLEDPGDRARGRVSPLAPIHYKASSETYALSRKEIEALPRGNNNELHDVLLTIPSAVYGSLKQVHIRQDHANLQLRIDGVPIPDTVSSTFSDVISPRAWERADIILGGMEAQYGNKDGGGAGHHDEERHEAVVRIGAGDGRVEQDHQSVLRIRRDDRREVPVLYPEQPHGDQSGYRAADVGPNRLSRAERAQSDLHPRRLPARQQKQLHLVVL
jgi:hypothetical protein